MRDGDPNHVILRRWIADGSKLDLNQPPSVTGIEVLPINPIVQSTAATTTSPRGGALHDGSSRDVTQEAFIESGN